MTDRPCQSEQQARASKAALRAAAEANRTRQENKERLSSQICQKVLDLPEYGAAASVLIYVGTPREVRTDRLLQTSWDQGKQVVVPCCQGAELELLRIESMEDLAPRTLGILEPTRAVRLREDQHVDASQIDLVIAPGVAFDRNGGRVGYGKGFFDRVLHRARNDVVVVGLAFDCQVFPTVPMLPHDVFMHVVITEGGVYRRLEA
jgi:5-formyltetrahydrofolate cyclo-ligase